MKHRLPTVHLATGAYDSSGAHPRDELGRGDLLIPAPVVPWQMTIGTHKPENLWGMVHVTEAEVSHYLGADVAPPDFIPEEVVDVVQHFGTAEEEAAGRIRKAVERTPGEVDLRVNRMARTFGLSN